MEKLRTGIIGCGKVGDFHAKAYANLPNSEFAAVCDANLERAQAFAARYGVKAYTDVAEMCRDAKLDVVSVCTPHPLHANPAVTAADCGCNVLVEKPLASSLKDCDAIIEAEKRNRVTVGTMVQRRFYRPCMWIRRAIEDGKLGRPVLGMVTMLGWRDENYYNSDPWRGTWDGEGGGLGAEALHRGRLQLRHRGGRGKAGRRRRLARASRRCFFGKRGERLYAGRYEHLRQTIHHRGRGHVAAHAARLSNDPGGQQL